MLYEIKKFCREKQISHSRFGTLAVGDSSYVGRVIQGRTPSDQMEARIRAFISDNAEAVFDYVTLTPASLPPRQFINPDLRPYAGGDDWQRNIASGTVALYNAIARSHPERITA